MDDPFSDLLKSLQDVFHLEAMRNEKYIYPAVQRLKEALEQYHPKEKGTFTNLLKAIKESLPHIEKWRISFDSIKKSMDELATRNKMPAIDWTKILKHPKISPKFQFGALNHSAKDIELSAWIISKTGKTFFQMNSGELSQALLDHKDKLGFSQKVSGYLKKYPDFLFQLIMDSEKNFIKLCHSRLILYLTDQQIAKAIIKHIPSLVHKRSDPFEQVEQLVNTLNDILSNGRSVSTLLRNAEAKPVLLNSIYFQLHQSEGYINREAKPQHSDIQLEIESLKPDL